MTKAAALDEMDDEALVKWMAEWGHGWPRRFLDTYGREIVVPGARALSRLTWAESTLAETGLAGRQCPTRGGEPHR